MFAIFRVEIHQHRPENEFAFTPRRVPSLTLNSVVIRMVASGAGWQRMRLTRFYFRPKDGHQMRGMREPISLAIFEASQQAPVA